MISSVKTLSETAQTQQQIARNIAEQAKCIQDILQRAAIVIIKCSYIIGKYGR